MEIYIDVTLFIFFYLVINQKSSPLQIPQKRSSNSQVQHQSAVGRNFQIPGCMKSNASSKKVKAGLLHNFLQNLRAMSYINFQNKHIYIYVYIYIYTKQGQKGDESLCWCPKSIIFSRKPTDFLGPSMVRNTHNRSTSPMSSTPNSTWSKAGLNGLRGQEVIHKIHSKQPFGRFTVLIWDK